MLVHHFQSGVSPRPVEGLDTSEALCFAASFIVLNVLEDFRSDSTTRFGDKCFHFV
jgi:hypothetical protein